MKKVLLIGSEGYIGSVLKPALKSADHEVTCLDMNGNAEICGNYAKVDLEDLEYDSIILLAGNSSVASCSDFQDTYWNNVENFKNFLDKIHPATKLIYASSGSVYNGNNGARETDPLYPPTNNYDMSKQVIDLIAQKSGKRAYGLRFGTVCMPSPNQRMDLLVQKMAWNAIHHGRVEVYNRLSTRSILGGKDLVNAIKQILKHEGTPGVYNVASMYASIGRVAELVALKFNARVEDKGTVPGGYSFAMNLTKMFLEFDFHPEQNTQEIIDQFSKDSFKDITPENMHLYERR